MKKINSFLTLLLLTVALPASADFVEDPLNTHCVVDEIGAATSTITTDTQWYVIYQPVYQSGHGGGYWEDHGYTTGSGSGTAIYISEGTGVILEGSTTGEAAAPYLVRFISGGTSGLHPEYYIQFATGNYVHTPNSDTDMATLTTVDSFSDANTLYAYLITDAEDGNWAFNTTEGYDKIIDNNGAGSTVDIWSSGDVESEGGNNDWFIYPVTLKAIESDDEWALLELATVYAEYAGYSGTFNTTGTFDYYDATAVAAFEAAIETAGEFIDSPDASTPSASESEKMMETIQSTYEAVIASYVPRAKGDIETGYYYLNNALQYYVTTTTEDPLTTEEVTETTYYTKGMYSAESGGTIYALWDTHEESAPYLWYITNNGDNTYSVVNAATGATFDDVETSNGVTMTVDGENLMAFDQVIPEDGDSINLAIRVSTQAEDYYYYLHCGGHSSGAGVSGSIVGWSIDAAASQWYLVPVSDEDAAELIAAYDDSDEKRWNDAQDVIADALEKMTIAEDILVGTDGLIESADQLSSPYSQNDLGSEDGGGLETLIDNDASTYWHSYYDGGIVDDGTHYIQVELPEDEGELVFVFTRRSSNNDHILLWGVYGTNDANAGEAESDCSYIAQISTPFGSSGETLTSDVFDATGYKYLRFYADETTGYADGSRGYFHLAEFQLYTVTVNPTSQMVEMGSVYTDLEAAVAAAQAEGSANDGLSKTTYNTLMSAYEAFIAAFVDPTELRTALSNAEEAVASVVTGTNPGYWSAEDTSLNSTISNATAYDAAGKYTQTESDTYVTQLNDGVDNLMASAIGIQEGKWYEIRYASEDEMTAHSWSTGNAVNESYNFDLRDTYLCVADFVTEEGQDDDEVGSIEPLGTSALEDVCVGQQLHFADKQMDISDEDGAKFRFVNVGDTAYMIQNKATGLFIRAAGETGAVSLSAHPTLFNVSAIGYGENLISGVTTDGENCNNLHAQLAYQVLVTWAASDPGTNSGLYIEDTGEAVASDYEGTSFNIAVVPGTYNFFCFGTGVTAEEGTMYGVQSVSGTTITLKQIEGNKAEPGQPFVFVNGTYDETETDAEVVNFSHDYTVAAEAQIVGEMVGVYYSEEIGAGKGVASDDAIVVSTSSSTETGDNSAYISTAFETGAELTIVIDADGYFDSIEEAVAATTQAGNIYTIDGKLVGKGDLSKVKSLGKGIYILNGAKILVK